MAAVASESHQASQSDLLIVGAGSTGLALAAQLQRFGVRFKLIDIAPGSAHESRA